MGKINIIMGDFGISINSGRNISEIVSSSIGTSLFISIISLVISMFLGIVLGTISAFNNHRIIDKVITFISNIFISIPNFVMGTLVLYIFCLKLKLFAVWNIEINYFLPILTLCLYSTSKVAKLAKTSILKTINSNYVEFLLINGISKPKIIFKHCLRNAINPIIAYLGTMFISIFFGNFAIETIFGIGGLGVEFINSINTRDYPLIMSITIISTATMVLIYLISEILYILNDPRINSEEEI